VATVDANVIAVANRLGTAALPIVNTTMLGAAGRLLGLDYASLDAALANAGLGGANCTAAAAAFDRVRWADLPGEVAPTTPAAESVGPAFTAEIAGATPTTHTGEWASRRPRTRQLAAVCGEACPAGNDVRGFVQAATAGDNDLAHAILLQTTPFPGTCGRVCPAPCTAACNRGLLDEPVNVRELERAVSDAGARPAPVVAGDGAEVAVVGAGPAGLSAAYHLARAGYRVTVLEAGSELGGLLRTGIPPYRLPRRVLDAEIGYILDHGVRVETCHPVDGDELLRLSRDYAAVFVATGMQRMQSIDLANATPDRVLQGIDVLDKSRLRKMSLIGENVIVVGGGNTAVDSARSALRLGADNVRIVYRRTRLEMPAMGEEVEEALEEGIGLDELVAPVELREASGGLRLVCRRMRLAEADASGRRRPVPVEGDGAVVALACSRVVLALGQSPDLSVLPHGAEIRGSRVLGCDTGSPLFAGGDLATKAGTVTAAIGSGRIAAAQMQAELCGVPSLVLEPPPVAGPDVVALERFASSPQDKGVLVGPAKRRRSFIEVRRGLRAGANDDAVVAEAERCLSCGSCNRCESCASFCPEGTMCPAAEGGYRFDYDYCKGCGLCAAQCPRGVIVMEDCAEEVYV
jgi:NADPH-dependent glutamate synthase beta subunit-like oxidoreductase/Pyruvate/2-oxoacid:ferredoxin oxidoreductase delta subunit